MINEKKLIDFIAKSKRQTYASEKAKAKRTSDGGKTYTVKKGDLKYTDTYFGNLVDCGQERVYHKGKVVWVMAYRGGMIEKDELSEEAFGFLKKCISNTPKQFPARGPKKMKQGKYTYENKWKGDIWGFVGEENIYFEGKQICFRNYIGGLVKNKK